MAMIWTTDDLTHLALHHAGWGLIDTRGGGKIAAYVGQLKYDVDELEMPKLGKWHVGAMFDTLDDAKTWIEMKIRMRYAQANVAEIGTTGGG